MLFSETVNYLKSVTSQLRVSSNVVQCGITHKFVGGYSKGTGLGFEQEVGSDERKRKTLSEAAREYEESRAVKRKYEEVAVKTGEEEEINVLQINCKLFAFNKDKSTWVERGRGTLRLNDLSADNRNQSRVVMRVSGSLRVVLNTKIWAEMAVDKPSEKSVRMTAMDNSGEIKVFLIMAGVKEVDQLFKALEWRVNNQKKLAKEEKK